jgi:hypothetical protein
MKHFIILIIAAVPHIFAFGQNMEITWQSCFGGTGQDIAYDIIEVPGGYFITGYTWSIDGDIYFNNGLLDGWLIKTDTVGNILWEKTYGGSSGDGFFRIFPDISGNYLIVGGSGSSDGDISYNPYPGSESFWIVKIDIEGNIIWDKIVGGSYGDKIWNASSTLDGGVVAIGQTTSDDGDVSVFYGYKDTWMVKLSTEGEVEWDYTIGTGWFDIGQAIIQTSDGGYLAGSNSIILEGAVGNITCIPPSYGYVTGVLSKFDANMSVQWQRCFGGNNHDAIVGMLELDDGYILTGSTESTNIPGHKGDGDVWVVRIDFDGNIIWQKAFGGSRNEAGYNIFTSEDGGFIVAGITQSNNGDVSGNHGISEHYTDIWMFKINGDGILQWQQCFGGAGREEIYKGVVRKSDNNFVIAGVTSYGPSHDVGCTPYGGNSGLDKDFWVFEILNDDTVNIVTPPASAREIKVYPNPATTETWLQLPENITLEKARVELYSPTGRLLCKAQPTSYFHKIETANLPKGLYLVRLWNGERWIVEKLVVR